MSIWLTVSTVSSSRNAKIKSQFNLARCSMKLAFAFDEREDEERIMSHDELHFLLPRGWTTPSI